MISRLLSSKSLSKCGLSAYWFAMFVATHWPEINRYKPDTGWPIPKFELVAHVGVYAIWTVMWWWMLRAHGRPLKGATAAWVTIGGVVYGIFDELTQALVDRTPSIKDLMSNFAGILIAIVILQALDRFLDRRHR